MVLIYVFWILRSLPHVIMGTYFTEAPSRKKNYRDASAQLSGFLESKNMKSMDSLDDYTR
jgi:hypothetical protein